MVLFGLNDVRAEQWAQEKMFCRYKIQISHIHMIQTPYYPATKSTTHIHTSAHIYKKKI